MNKVYEFSNVGDVLIKTSVPMTIGGREYAANEPYTILKDVEVRFVYDNTTSTASAKQLAIAAQQAIPAQINITPTALTQKICDLVLTNIVENSLLQTKQEIIYATNNTLFLSEAPATQEVFVYDQTMQKITDITLNGNEAISESFNDNEPYLVFYSTNIAAKVFNLEVPHYPYFSLEITIKGNVDKSAGKLHFNFPATSLISVPRFDINKQNLLNVPFVFAVIASRQKLPIIWIED